MYGICFGKLRGACIGLLVLLSLTACEYNSNPPDTETDIKELVSPTENAVIVESKEDNQAASSAEVIKILDKRTVAEDTDYYYIIQNHYLVSINKETYEISLLCKDEQCKHSKTNACNAYIVQNILEVQKYIWVVEDELFFVSKAEDDANDMSTLYTIDKINLLTGERSNVMEIASVLKAELYYDNGHIYYFAGNAGKYCISTADIRTCETTVLAETQMFGERLIVDKNIAYYIEAGKLYALSLAEKKSIFIDEKVVDFDIEEEDIFYMKAGEGVFKTTLSQEAPVLLYSEYPIKKDNPALKKTENGVVVYYSNGDIIVLNDDGSQKEKLSGLPYMSVFGELRSVKNGFLVGNENTAYLYRIKFLLNEKTDVSYIDMHYSIE